MLRRWVDVDIALDSEMEAELLGANFPRDRVKRMVNGIDIDAFPVQADTVAAKAALGLAGKKVLLFTGRLAPQKALPDTLTALHRALVECPELHLLLIGEGSERAMLEQRVSELSLGQHVTFVGNVADVRKYLDGADIFVLSSVSEGISNALLEAMASGLACIATAVGGTPEVLEQGKCGVLLPPERPELLAAAIVDLCRRPAEVARLGAVARERILSHYAFSVVGNQYIALYERLLQGETRVSTVSKQITK
jgi:glycosyltransferase involved in cell wall biosynthesis